MKKIAFGKEAVRVLRRMPANQSTLIRAKLQAYARNPTSQGNNVRTLKGTDVLRLRIGDWRAIFEETDDTIIVVKIASRGNIY